MAIENVYSYLEYLALTVDQLADAVIEREEESAVYEARLQEMAEELAVAQAAAANAVASASVEIQSDEARIQDILDQATARIQLAEARAIAAEKKAEELAIMLKTAKQTKRVVDAQIDMFAAPSAPAPKAVEPVGTKSNKVANDENALILAKKLDSTIDKVQKLIREARA